MPWAARPNGSAAAPTAGLGALRPLLVLQLFAPARGRAASLDGCALPPLRKLPITGGLGADRRKPALGPSRGLGDASGALIRFHGDGLAGRLGVALVAPRAGKKALGDAVAARCDAVARYLDDSISPRHSAGSPSRGEHAWDLPRPK